MRMLNKVKHGHTICLNFGDIFFLPLTGLVLEAETSIFSAIKENTRCYIFLNFWDLLLLPKCNIFYHQGLSQKEMFCETKIL